MSGIQKTIAFLFFILLTIFCQAAEVVIMGAAPNYAGKTIHLVAFTDHYTKNKVFLEKTQISEDGLFQFSTELSEIQYMHLQCDRVYAPLYLNPGTSYHVEFPLPSSGTTPLNYSGTAHVDLTFNKLAPEDPNSLILKYNTLHEQFFDEHYEELRVILNPDPVGEVEGQELSSKGKAQLLRELLDKLKNRCDTTFSGIQSAYLRAHINSITADLHMMSRSQASHSEKNSHQWLYDTYMKGYAWNPQHPEQCHFHKRFYDSYLETLMQRYGAEIKAAIQQDGGTKKLMNIINDAGLLETEELRSSFLIHSLATLSNQSQFLLPHLTARLKEAEELSQSEQVKHLAHHVAKRISRAKEGYAAWDFNLPDSFNELHQLKKMKGKKTCLIFWASWSRSSQMEMAVLTEIKKKFSPNIQFVYLCMDDNIEQMTNYLRDYPPQKGLYLYAGDDPQIKEEYVVASLPLTYLIDENGLFEEVECPVPSEGLSDVLTKAMRKSRDNKGFRPGQKEN